MSQPTTIVFCRCAYSQIIPEAAKQAVLCGVTDLKVLAVDDLCGLAARHDPQLAEMAAGGDVRIIACFPRVVRWLFEFAGDPLPADARIFNMRAETSETIVAGVRAGIATAKRKTPRRTASVAADGGEDNANAKKADWIPWYPVIDYSRCHNCRQCANFCLFGVYGLSPGGKVQVQKPAKCKTNCPACARLCPRAAIMFPKYDAAPINGGEVTEESIRDQNVGADLAKLKNSDLYAALRERRRANKSDE